MADLMKTMVQLTEQALERFDKGMILSRAALADGLVQRMVAAGFHLRDPKTCSFPHDPWRHVPPHHYPVQLRPSG